MKKPLSVICHTSGQSTARFCTPQPGGGAHLIITVLHGVKPYPCSSQTVLSTCAVQGVKMV